MSRYYGFTINEIGDMSIYQFNSYLGEIAEVEKMFSGGEAKPEGKDTTTTEELMKRAKKAGIKTPTNY
jgi:hypothetical protein